MTPTPETITRDHEGCEFPGALRHYEREGCWIAQRDVIAVYAIVCVAAFVCTLIAGGVL